MLLTRASQTVLSGSDFTSSQRPAAWSCGSDYGLLSVKAADCEGQVPGQMERILAASLPQDPVSSLNEMYVITGFLVFILLFPYKPLAIRLIISGNLSLDPLALLLKSRTAEERLSWKVKSELGGQNMKERSRSEGKPGWFNMSKP